MSLITPQLEIRDRADTDLGSGCQESSLSTAPAQQIEHLCSSSINAEDKNPGLAVPRRGHVLSTVAEIYGRPIRDAVGLLTNSLAKKSCSDLHKSLFAADRWPSASNVVRSEAEMVAWATVSMWVVGVAIKAIPISASLGRAEKWFFGTGAPRTLTSLASAQVVANAENVLQTSADASAYSELLPYILDPHGPGSRLSVRRDPATRAARSRKRAEGVFYTPPDVAEYMVCACLDSLGEDKPPTIFDPACGTGVFLRASLKEILRRLPEQNAFSVASDCLFGTDIDPWPLGATAFVLLADSWVGWAKECITPAEAWRRLLLNLACTDTLCIDPAVETLTNRGRSSEVDDHSIYEIKDASSAPVDCQGDAARISISQLFPELRCGPRVILGNPPYATLGDRSDLPALQGVFETLKAKPQASAEIYLSFIEQMTRLADSKTCAGSFVVPLSIACNIGPQFIAARTIISKTKGDWKCAFFDREPHALFGEDVKTRNAIIIWSRTLSNRCATISTGPLRKWRAEGRAEMFRTLAFTNLDSSIRAGIPKVDGPYQATALDSLLKRSAHLGHSIQGISRLNLAEVPSADGRTVFVGPTAYNFLNVFLKPKFNMRVNGLRPSNHSLHAIKCSSRDQAFAVFAIFSSHLAYWWWHTHGDGFHVSKRFISYFPFDLESLAINSARELSACGVELWSLINADPIISVNRGRSSLAYSPNGYDHIRRKTDRILADLAGIRALFVDELQQFTAHKIAAKPQQHATSELTELDGT